MVYKPGDVITPIDKSQSLYLDKLTIVRVDSKNYYCKIINGIAIIPKASIERNYELYKGN